MKEKSDVLRSLEAAVSGHNENMMCGALSEACDSGIALIDIRRALTQGLENIRLKLMSNSVSLPDFILCMETMTGGLDRLSSLEEYDNNTKKAIPLIIGVVEGDPHDLGKNIIAAAYRAFGYRVVDLGCDVKKEQFVRCVKDTGAQVLALSAMMSTTASVMRDIIYEVKTRAPKTVVMVGGASVDKCMGKSFGADGYADTVVTVLEETEDAVRRVGEGRSW